MILSVSSRAFVDACEQLGLDVPALLREAEIDEAVLRDPDGRLPTPAVRRLWTIALERSGDPDLALHASEALPFGAYRVIDFLVANAPTVGVGLAKLAEYFPIINPAVRLHLKLEGAQARFVMVPELPGTVGRQYAEYVLCTCLLRTRIATGVDFPVAVVNFEHAAPPRVAEHERIFGCPVRFGRSSSEWVMDHAWLERPVVQANRELFSVLDKHARLLTERVPASPLLERLREDLLERLNGGVPTLSEVAAGLAMSPRTLQRQLAAQGLSFSEALDGARREVAVAALEQGRLSVGEVGFLLGFATQASFSRAFKRWTGWTPSDWRSRAQGA